MSQNGQSIDLVHLFHSGLDKYQLQGRLGISDNLTMKIRILTPDKELCFEMKKEVISLGRDETNDFIIPISDFSRKHCQITKKGNYCYIMDVGSKNGVMVDGQRIKPQMQIPVYPHTRIVLANLYECFLFEENQIRYVSLNLELGTNKKHNG